MKYMFIGAAAFMMLAPSFAQAQEMTDGRYISASRCVAYASLSQFSNDAFDVSALNAEIASYAPGYGARGQAREAAGDARRAGMRAGDNERSIANLRDRRDQACAGFTSSGVVQANTTNPAS